MNKGPHSKLRRTARLAAVQALYQMDVGGILSTSVVKEFIEHRFGLEDETDYIAADEEFFTDLVEGVVRYQEEIDKSISDNLWEKWSLKRLDLTLRAIMRSAGYEIQRRPDVPALARLIRWLNLCAKQSLVWWVVLPRRMDEFDFIATYLAPLAGLGGLGLKDDAATLTPLAGKDLILTKDTMVEGVHFPQGHYGGDTAEKLLRVNLSDLAAKGASPIGYLLSISWPKDIDRNYFKGFARGLRDVQDAFDFKLLGGDTTSIDGPMVVTATLIGEVPAGEMVERAGAEEGDDIWVTGTIGDAYLGLQTVLGQALEPQPRAEALWHFEKAYYRPEPRLLFRKALRSYARSCADISDGFVADAGHVAGVSEVSFKIDADKIPLSSQTGIWLSGQDDQDAAFKTLLTAGDDYELIFTARPEHATQIRQAAKAIGMRVSRVGQVDKGEGITVISDGQMMQFHKTGHTHF
jgi:thiamine-monophosphate kinase